MKLVKVLPAFLVLALSVNSAHAIFDDSAEQPSSKVESSWLNDLVATGLADFTDYQIGDEWGKKPTTRETLKGHSPAFIRTSLATARYGGGTAFYLGKFNGHHMMATNHHVMPDARICGSRSAIFPLLQLQFHCEKFYGDWTGIDLALFSITVTQPEDEEKLAQIAGNFAWHKALYPGQELITAGYGVFRNQQRNLVVNDDGDCKVFSGKSDYRFIADPDKINPADYQAWSFATGCDVSHGDSGSSMVDRVTGEVVGIIWTTATQKPERIRSSSYLTEVLAKQSDDSWQWLSYGVPAPKIFDFLKEKLQSGAFKDPDTALTIETVLRN